MSTSLLQDLSYFKGYGTCLLPALDLLLDEGLLLALLDGATVDLGKHLLAQANVAGVLAEEVLVNFGTLAGGRLHAQLAEARSLV